MFVLFSGAGGLWQGEGIHQQVVTAFCGDREYYIHRPGQLPGEEGDGEYSVLFLLGFDGTGVADRYPQGRIGDRRIRDGIVNEDRKLIVLQNADDLVKL